MRKRDSNLSFENLSTGYDGIVNYHNNLAQIRFTAAGLSVAADGFLASALFQASAPEVSQFFISTLGIVLTFICGMLEIRTLQFLYKLLDAGYAIEKRLGFSEDQGVFYVLTHSQIVPRFLSKSVKGSVQKENKFVFSHSVMFWLLYICIFVFWIFMLVLVLLRIV